MYGQIDERRKLDEKAASREALFASYFPAYQSGSDGHGTDGSAAGGGREDQAEGTDGLSQVAEPARGVCPKLGSHPAPRLGTPAKDLQAPVLSTRMILCGIALRIRYASVERVAGVGTPTMFKKKSIVELRILTSPTLSGSAVLLPRLMNTQHPRSYVCKRFLLLCVRTGLAPKEVLCPKATTHSSQMTIARRSGRARRIQS